MIQLDTHVAVWLTQDRSKLSQRAALAVQEGDRSGGLAVAAITLYEVASIVIAGRLSISAPLPVYLEFIQSFFHVLPLTAAIAERATRFSNLYPRDPGDRMIGATAIVHGLKLVTKDTNIRASKEVDCIW